MPIPWCDTLEIVTPGSRRHPESSWRPVQGETKDNLIHKCPCLARRATRPPAGRLPPHQVYPLRAGLGGGSADGAFALTLLDAHFNLGHSIKELEELAASWVRIAPSSSANVPARVTGRGEHVDPIDLRLAGWHIALINPAFTFPPPTPLMDPSHMTTDRDSMHGPAPAPGSMEWPPSTTSPPLQSNGTPSSEPH